jgi:hypothetical protein
MSAVVPHNSKMLKRDNLDTSVTCDPAMPAPVNDVIACFNYLTSIGNEICTGTFSVYENICTSGQAIVNANGGDDTQPPATAPWYVSDFAILPCLSHS